METTIADLEQQLSDKELETNSVVEQWQSTVSALKATNDELIEQVQVVNEQLQSAQEECSLLQTKLSEAETAMNESQEKLSQSEGECVFAGDKVLVSFWSKMLTYGVTARIIELETATATLENNLQVELSSLRESTAFMEVELKDRETALAESMERVASAETTIQEWESTSMIIFVVLVQGLADLGRNADFLLQISIPRTCFRIRGYRQ